MGLSILPLTLAILCTPFPGLAIVFRKPCLDEKYFPSALSSTSSDVVVVVVSSDMFRLSCNPIKQYSVIQYSIVYSLYNNALLEKTILDLNNTSIVILIIEMTRLLVL